MRYFKMIRRVNIGTLSISLSFERSEGIPCDHMEAHAETVVEAVRNMVDEDDEPSITAARICETFQHLSSVRVLTDDGEGGIAYS
jgi:hypothetical protein